MPGPRRKRGTPAPARRLKKDGRPADNAREAGIGGFEVSEIRRLIRLVRRSGIGELELSSGGRSIRVAAAGSTPAVIGAAPAPVAAVATVPAAPVAAAVAPPADDTVAITSPMVGTFYRAPAPDADPYVEVGDLVEIGQTVCIVEAMKLMNEIQAETKGRVVKILVENAQPVEFGQPLFLVGPA